MESLRIRKAPVRDIVPKKIKEKRKSVLVYNDERFAASPCMICNMKEKNILRYGDFLHQELFNFQCHYFCLLSANSINQNGKDANGILGFLKIDILKGLKEFENTVCVYCMKKKAPISCMAPNCTSNFHFICGQKNNARTTFCDRFHSYCDKHNDIKYIFDSVDIPQYHDPSELCFMCYDKMGPYNPVTSIIPPCCKLQWFHRDCMLQYCQSSGYYTKCPLPACAAPEFKNIVEIYGVFVPSRDATWEMEPGAYAKLKNNVCSSITCCNPKKTYYVSCIVCHSVKIHRLCLSEAVKDDEYCCRECQEAGLLKLIK